MINELLPPSLFAIAIYFLIKYFLKFNREITGDSERVPDETQKEIIQELKEREDKAFNEARGKYPIGRSMIDREYQLSKDIIIKLDINPIFENGSFKVPAKKIPKGEIVEIIGFDSGHYIIKAKNIEKGYLQDEDIEGEIIVKQFDYQGKLLNQYIKEIAEKYNFSEKEILALKHKQIKGW